MINIDFSFRSPVDVRKDEFVLYVDYMHGDADGTTTIEHTYSMDTIDDLKRDLLGVITSTSTQEDIDASVDEVAAIFDAQGIEDAHGVADEWRDAFYEGDITCDGNAAAISGYSLEYYDDSGKMHDVAIIINGIEVS